MCALVKGRAAFCSFYLMRDMNKPSGFTLNELLVAVIIVALVVTFATETYVRTYEKSKGFNAVAILRMIRAAERIYYMDWNNYVRLTCPGSPLPSEKLPPIQ